VTLTAVPSPGYLFAGWSGALTGAANPATVAMTGVKSVTAGFTIKQFSLAVTSLNGTVTKSPDQPSYDSGTVVTLTAVASPGYSFANWSGDIAGTASPATVTLAAPRNVVAHFTVNAPDAPLLAAPADSLANADIIQVLTWNPAARAVSYHVQMSKSALFGDTIVDDTALTAVTMTVGPLANATTFYWRVQAKNDGGVSAWSVIRRFTTIVPAPSQPLLVSPADTAKLRADSAVFVWQKTLPGVDRYHLEIARDSLFANDLYSDTSLTDTVHAFKGLVNRTSYWWRVRGHNASGWGSFSAVSRFAVAIPSTAVLPRAFAFSISGMVNARSVISYALPVSTRVVIRIFGLSGKVMAVLCDAQQSAGYYHVPLGRLNVSNGYYLLDFKAGKYVVKKKLPLFK
jgi:hypothetical protein